MSRNENDTEPSAADLAAIEREMPLIDAEIALLDAQIVILTRPTVPSDLDWQRLRRARRQVMREAVALLSVRSESRPAVRRAVA